MSQASEAKIRLASLEAEVERMRTLLRDVLDAHWDMSPLEYAASRGLNGMSDKEGEAIRLRARAALSDKKGTVEDEPGF